MAIRVRLTILILAILFLFSAASAEIQLRAMTLPAGKEIQIYFSKTAKAPSRASMAAKLIYEKGITTIDISFEKMEPAILFAGDITTYVLWAVSPDGSYDNLGEIFIDRKEASGNQQFLAKRKILALMVTAEPFGSTNRPTEIVLFINGQSGEKGVQVAPFTFKDFSTEARPALDTISMLQYATDFPVAVTQAEKTIEYARKMKADEVNARAVEEAKKALEKARGTRDKKMAADTARIAVQYASQAIRETIRIREEKASAEAEAKRLAEKAALEQRASEAESEAQHLARQLEEIKIERAALAKEMEELARQTQALAAERDKLAEEREIIKKERDELAGKLRTALSTVSETTDTARGLIVNLAGILFDLNKATLKPESQLKLAKLAGILMVFPDMNLSIEGHTDSTGSEDWNFRLSTERARTVYEFLMGQGVALERMKYQGFGSSKPVAPNDTEANRARNRRVEVVVLRED